MSYPVELEHLRITLPNFPNELLEEWLLPYAKLAGWPPSASDSQVPEGRWRFLLKKQPLTYWRSIQWKKVVQHLSIYDLDPGTQEIMVDMMLGAVRGDVNLYSSSIKDLAARFNRITEYLATHGTFPKPPALLMNNQKITILDGNHRMAAYFYCCGCFKLTPNPELQLKTLREQTYWIGCS